MVLGSILTSVFVNTLSFVAYCKGFSGKNVDADEFNWSYMEREGKEQDTCDAVVFLAGFGAFKESWVRVACGMDRKYQVLIPDLPGQGRTTPVNALMDYSVDNQARRLHAFIEKTVPADKKVHLVGISMGGMISGVYAAKYPERIKSLTMICPAGIFMKNKSDAMRIMEDTRRNLLLAQTAEEINEMHKMTTHDAKDLPHFLAETIGKERAKQLPVLEKMASDCLLTPTILEEFLPKIRAKTLLMWGMNDRLLDVSCVERVNELMTVDEKHVVLFEECGHVVQHQKHQECTAAINQLLAGKVPTGLLEE
ncbi:Monoacylglycerol lipase abhd6-a [Globisporangium polare]